MILCGFTEIPTLGSEANEGSGGEMVSKTEASAWGFFCTYGVARLETSLVICFRISIALRTYSRREYTYHIDTAVPRDGDDRVEGSEVYTDLCCTEECELLSGRFQVARGTYDTHFREVMWCCVKSTWICSYRL